MENILDKIVAKKRDEISENQTNKSIQDLKNSPFFKSKILSAKASILDPTKSGIIAEHKRKSPSKGLINGNVSLEEVVSAYQNFGASVVSVLTDETFFGGNSQDLIDAKALLNIPVLRKDFIVEAYQVYETKAMGADLMLLIAECLTKEEVFQLSQLAHSIGLEVLLEMHEEDQLEKISPFIDLVGINNRNLKTFEVDLEKSKKLLKKLPKNLIKVAESGISSPEVVRELRNAGFQSFLIGENFMKEANPGLAFKEFVSEIMLVK